MDLNEYITKAIIAGFMLGKELTDEIDKIPDKEIRRMVYAKVGNQLIKQGFEYLNLAKDAIIEYNRIPYFKEDDYKHSQDNNKV